MNTGSSDLTALERKKSAILMAFCLLFSIALAFVLNRSSEIRYQSDLFARWYAAKHLFEAGRDLYDPHNAQEVIAYKTNPTTPLEAGFYYPAYLALLLWPLTKISFQGAHLVWTIVLQWMYLAGILIVAKATAFPASTNRLTLFVIGCLLFIPFLQNAIWSQFDTIAVLCLALCYLELRNGHYFRAGLWTAGLLFKPQAMLLALAFLLLWSVSSSKRWGYLAGLLLAGLVLGGAAQVVQPGWIGDFLRSLGEYGRLPYQIRSVADQLWNPHGILSAALVLASLAVFVYFRSAPASSPHFRICLGLSLCAWWLVVPIIGMLYLVMLPLAVLWILSGLQQLIPSGGRLALCGILCLYLVGWAGFVYGLSTPARYGLHIQLAEGALKVLAPLFLLSFSVYGLFFRRKSEVAYAQ